MQKPVNNSLLNQLEEERQFLLELTGDLIHVHSKEELLRVLTHRLRRLPPFKTADIKLYPEDKSDSKPAISLPLQIGNTPIGTLFLYTHEPIKQDRRSKELTPTIANLVTNTLNHLLTQEKIQHQLIESNKYSHKEIIGSGPEMQKIFQLLTRVSPTNSTILLLGETGTGKELVANSIHHNSPRKNRLLVKVNCAALPSNLIESELFGHEKGSFTGASETRQGKFELASHGTLFLDEIGEMPLDLQVKLLRAIQEKEIERVGGSAPFKVDVRIIAATNRNLQKEMEEGRFRSDLFYRLNVFPITLPPLREHKEDIPALAMYFMDKYAKNSGKKVTDISNRVMDQLMAYSWPGNIRELEHLIERSVLLTKTPTIQEIMLPVKTKYTRSEESAAIKTLAESEKANILEALKHAKGKVSGPGGAAELLGLPYSTLNSRIKKLGIRKSHLFKGPE